MATHLCGGATDVAQQLCVERGAAFILTPCCVGKIKHLLSSNLASTSAKIAKHAKTAAAERAKAAVAARKIRAGDSLSPAVESKVTALEIKFSSTSKEISALADRISAASDRVVTLCERLGGTEEHVKDSQPDSRVRYPRSQWLAERMELPEYIHLVRLADYNHHTIAGAQRRSKQLLDADRLSFAAERGYETAAGVLWPLECSPKHDVLIGWKARGKGMQ